MLASQISQFSQQGPGTYTFEVEADRSQSEGIEGPLAPDYIW